MKKILFSDIDGTIANDNLPITYKDQEAVKKLRTQGHYFSFCTGRNIQETKLVTPHFEYDYLVLNNGAMIVDQNDQVLYRKQIKNEIAKEILKESYQKYPYLFMICVLFHLSNDLSNRKNKCRRYGQLVQSHLYIVSVLSPLFFPITIVPFSALME